MSSAGDLQAKILTAGEARVLVEAGERAALVINPPPGPPGAHQATFPFVPLNGQVFLPSPAVDRLARYTLSR